MALNIRNVLITDGISQICADILIQRGLNVTQVLKPSHQELLQLLETHDTLLVRSATRVTSEVVTCTPSLRLIGRAGTGVDNIDVAAASRQGVLVMNTPTGNTISAAEHTCALIMALSRQIPAACSSLKNGLWERGKFMGSELHGKTLAVLGLGRIGREVAHRMASFGMKVIAYDPVVSAEEAASLSVELCSLQEIWPRADYITVHTPLLPQTKHLINATALAQCQRGVRVVNVARGGIVDETALLAALNSGQCGGAGLDVFGHEPPHQQDVSSELVQHPAVVCTPHLGASTREAQIRVARELAEQVVAAADGRLSGLVNATFMTTMLSPELRPWIHLCQILGKTLVALLGGRLPRTFTVLVHLTAGKQHATLSDSLGQAVLAGVMAAVTNNGVNLVNASLQAHDAGVQLQFHRIPADTKQSTPSVSVRLVRTAPGADAVNSHGGKPLAEPYVAGTVFGNEPVLQTVAGRRVGRHGVSLNDADTLLMFGTTTEANTSAIATLIGWLMKKNVSVSSLLVSANTSEQESSDEEHQMKMTQHSDPAGLKSHYGSIIVVRSSDPIVDRDQLSDLPKEFRLVLFLQF